MDKLNKLPLLKADKDDPSSVIKSVSIIVGILATIIPIIFITFVLIS